MPLWVRPVDVPAVLCARRYEISDTVVFDLTDASLPDNAGRWRLAVSPDGATCDRSDAPADLGLDVADLATVMLGGVAPVALADAGRIASHTPGSVARLDRVFATDRAPATSFDF
jgi:predicted acetyltransferase